MKVIFRVICLLVIINLISAGCAEFYQSQKLAPAEFYAQYISEKLEYPFSFDSIELGDCYHGFSDQYLEIKACLDMADTSYWRDLLDNGWIGSPYPKLIESERILNKREPFGMEIIDACKEYDYVWMYRDDTMAEKMAGYTYRTWHFTFCVLIPELDILYYIEDDY